MPESGNNLFDSIHNKYIARIFVSFRHVGILVSINYLRSYETFPIEVQMNGLTDVSSKSDSYKAEKARIESQIKTVWGVVSSYLVFRFLGKNTV